MFKNEIKKHKKLKRNETFEFINQDKNCDKQKILNLSKRIMIYISVDGCIEFRQQEFWNVLKNFEKKKKKKIFWDKNEQFLCEVVSFFFFFLEKE